MSNEIIVNKQAKYKPFKRPNYRLINNYKLKNYLINIKTQNLDVPELDLKTRFRYIATIFNTQIRIEKYKSTDTSFGHCFIDNTRRFICIKLRRSARSNKTIFLHELSHIIQWDFNLSRRYIPQILSKEIKVEQQAETIAYYLSKAFFKEEKFTKDNFIEYFEPEYFHKLYLLYTELGYKIKNDLFWEERKK